MSDMSYTLEQFEQDKQTLLNLIADCEELEKRENGDEYFISMTDLRGMIGALLYLEDKTLNQFIAEEGDEPGSEFIIAEAEGTISSYRHILNNLVVFETDKRIAKVNNVEDLLAAFPPQEDS